MQRGFTLNIFFTIKNAFGKKSNRRRFLIYSTTSENVCEISVSPPASARVPLFGFFGS